MRNGAEDDLDAAEGNEFNSVSEALVIGCSQGCIAADQPALPAISKVNMCLHHSGSGVLYQQFYPASLINDRDSEMKKRGLGKNR